MLFIQTKPNQTKLGLESLWSRVSYINHFFTISLCHSMPSYDAYPKRHLIAMISDPSDLVAKFHVVVQIKKKWKRKKGDTIDPVITSVVVFFSAICCCSTEISARG